MPSNVQALAQMPDRVATQMRSNLGAEETELLVLTDSTLGKLRNMSDTEYVGLDLFPDFDAQAES